jgi:hypothetical protein
VSSVEIVNNLLPTGETGDMQRIISDGISVQLAVLPFPPFHAMTFTVWVRADAETSMAVELLGVTDTCPITTEWTRWKKTVTAPAGTRISLTPADSTPVYLCMAQLEMGEMASDWHAAPEDVDEIIKEAQMAAVDAIDTLGRLAVGGVNLIENSAAVTITGTDVAANSRWEAATDLLPGQIYTLSMAASALIEGSAAGMTCEVVRLAEDSEPEMIQTTHLLEFSGGKTQWTFATSEDGRRYALRIYAGVKGSTNGVTVELTKVKLEEGTFATTWTEALADTEGRLVQVWSQLEQTRNGLSEIVTHITTDLDGTERLVSSFFAFADEGDGIMKLTMGSSANPMKVVLSSNRLSFQNAGVEMAYFSDNKLYVTNVEAMERLSLGTPTNGYLDFVTTPTGAGLVWRT